MQSPSHILAIPTATVETLANSLSLLGRLLLAYLFVVEGCGKIFAYADVQFYMAQYGVSPSLLPLVIVTELGGGLLIALGLFTRPVAFALGGFCVLTALIFHHSGADAAIGLEKDLSIAGGFFELASRGTGAWAVDSWLGARARFPRSIDEMTSSASQRNS